MCLGSDTCLFLLVAAAVVTDRLLRPPGEGAMERERSAGAAVEGKSMRGEAIIVAQEVGGSGIEGVGRGAGGLEVKEK